jgi:hypothetical protein
MTDRRSGKSHRSSAFVGVWHIYAMELWEADYFNMERQAYIEVQPDALGSFQFGLVVGAINGRVRGESPRERFEFTWEGSDEGDQISGSGTLKFHQFDAIFGQFRIHLGDRSRFSARRAPP